MWFLRAPVRITLLYQGSQLGPQGTAKGMKMENVWWAKKTETTLMWFLRALVRITLLQQGSQLGHQVTAKGTKMENVCWVKKHKRFLCKFCSRLSGSHFCRKDPSRDTQGQSEEWKWEMSDGGKNINNLYAHFVSACKDYSFAARIQVGASRDGQRNENWKCLMGKKT